MMYKGVDCGVCVFGFYGMLVCVVFYVFLILRFLIVLLVVFLFWWYIDLLRFG